MGQKIQSRNSAVNAKELSQPGTNRWPLFQTGSLRHDDGEHPVLCPSTSGGDKSYARRLRSSSNRSMLLTHPAGKRSVSRYFSDSLPYTNPTRRYSDQSGPLLFSRGNSTSGPVSITFIARLLIGIKTIMAMCHQSAPLLLPVTMLQKNFFASAPSTPALYFRGLFQICSRQQVR